MLNVLTISTLYPNRAQPNFGGFVERQTKRLAALPDVNLMVAAPIGRFVLPIGPYAPLWDIPDREHRNGVDVAYPRFPVIPAVGWRLNPALVRRAVLGMLGSFDFKPDVIDCEFFWPDGPAAVAIGKALGIPVSIKARGSDIRYWGERPAARRLMIEAAYAADGLLAVSSGLRDDMAAIGMPAEKIIVHHTGIELDRFQPGDRASLKAEMGVAGPLLLAAGNLVALKRHSMIIEAAALLPGATLLIAGAGRERARLQELIEERGVGNRVRLLGAVDHAAMPNLMAAADVFVHAASSEGLANVWVEALASGTPVVTSRVGGAAEVIDRPEAGRLIDEASPEKLADAISELLASPPDPAAVRAAALRFDWSANTDALYRHLARVARRTAS